MSSPSSTSARQASAGPAPASPPAGIDPRGPRFAATITTVLLAAAVLTLPSAVGVTLLAVQTAVFAWGAIRGVAGSPYGVLYRRLVRPHLGPPTDLEDPRPPRFAQTVGLVFSGVGLVAVLTGATTLGLVAVGFALAAAFANAAFAFCLGCELYLLLARLRRPSLGSARRA
jgi:hypothetical protein